MGRDLGRAVPVRRPTLAIRAVLVSTLVTGAALAVLMTPGAATAADPTPTPDPFSTPASTPAVSPPSQQQIDDARAALERLRNGRKPSPAPLEQVAGPAAGGVSVVSRISDEAWWTISAGLLVLLVASETTRLSVRRAKHRKQA